MLICNNILQFFVDFVDFNAIFSNNSIFQNRPEVAYFWAKTGPKCTLLCTLSVISGTQRPRPRALSSRPDVQLTMSIMEFEGACLNWVYRSINGSSGIFFKILSKWDLNVSLLTLVRLLRSDGIALNSLAPWKGREW